jgi:hypothetical protein
LSTDITILLKAVDKASDTIKGVAATADSSLGKMKDANNKVEKSSKEVALAFNNVATSGLALYGAVDRIQTVQVALDRANLMVKTSANAVEDAQRKYNATVEKFGVDSQEATLASGDLKLAQERYEVACSRAELAQGNVNQAMMSAVVTVIPSMIRMLTSLGKIWGDLPSMIHKVSERISGVGISASTALVGVAALVGAFIIFNTVLDALPASIRGIVAPIMAAAAAIVIATVAWMAFQGTVTLGIAVPIILAAVGAGIAGIKAMIGMAQGGIVTRPTLALIGEAGPEAVIPLGHMTPSVTININSPLVNVEGNADMATAKLAVKLIRQNLQNVILTPTSMNNPLRKRIRFTT